MTSERTLPQAREVRWPRPRRRPAEAAVLLGNHDIVDAGFAAAHQAVLVELPLLVAIGAMPLPGIVMPLVLKTHRDAVLIEPPEVLDEAVFVLSRPLPAQERDDSRTALEEF